MYSHQEYGSSRDESALGLNTNEPGTSFSGKASGYSFRSGCRSAIVTYPVARMNRANSSFVTSVPSIQKPLMETECAGRSSGAPCSDPIRNLPGGIQIIPFVQLLS